MSIDRNVLVELFRPIFDGHKIADKALAWSQTNFF